MSPLHVIYQTKLRDDFRRRRVHPTIEALIRSCHLGKPTQPIALNGSMALEAEWGLTEAPHQEERAARSKPPSWGSMQ